MLSGMNCVHFIGIGGIGISAIARMMLAEGKAVTGSDCSSSSVTLRLERLGAKIFYAHRSEHLSPEVSLVVYSTAVPADNPELQEAHKLGIPTLSYPEMLGRVTKDKYTIAVSGTHGKTTTTAMLAEILLSAAFDPTVIVGSLLLSHFAGWRTNFIAGHSRYFLVEACEYRRSFLNLSPQILIITNIDNDHLDYYRDITDIQSAFIELAAKIPTDGFLITDVRSERLQPILQTVQCQVIDYQNVKESIKLSVPGRHNLLNARAAFAAAKILGITSPAALGALKNFKGTWRRFEYKGKMSSGAEIFDDYAHHPTEIKATLETAHQLAGGRRLRVVFQPHLYSRTKLLFNELAESFTLADEVIVTEIYAAREPKDEMVTAGGLARAIAKNGQDVRYLKTFAEIKKYLEKTGQKDDLILTLGAGNIFGLAEDLVYLV